MECLFFKTPRSSSQSIRCVMPKELDHFDICGQSVNDAVPGKMFGHPVYKVKKKAFTCYFHKDMVFKLDPTNLEKALALKGSKLFDPSGKDRPMKEWVQVKYLHKDDWPELSNAAAEYVLSLLK